MMYYFQENKLIVCVIGVIVVGVVLYLSYTTSATNLDKTYKVGSTFVYRNLNITIKDSIISNLDYRGNKINEGKYYLALKMNVSNKYGDSIVLDYNNFKLNVGGVTIVPSNNYVRGFLDYNSPTIPKMYTPNVDKDVIIIYELNDQLINKKMKLQLYNGSTYKNGEYYDKNIYINISPKVIDDVGIVGNYILKEEVKLEDTFLANTTVTINSHSISKNQLYSYTACITPDDCREFQDMITASMASGRSSNDILLLKTDLVYDEDTDYFKSFGTYSSFAEHFVSIQYKIGDKVVSDKAINVTPDQDGIDFFAFEVPAETKNASLVQVIITIRNKRYIVNMTL